MVDVLELLLTENPKGYSEHQLLTLLQQAPHDFFAADALRDPLVLFQSHFLLFHCLYLLRGKWHNNQSSDLEISALSIKIQPLPLIQAHKKKSLLTADPLAQYYLDWSHFAATSSDDVEVLLNSFWKKMCSPFQQEDISRALKIMELENPVSIAQLKVQYRRLAQNHHPDKGGDSDHFKKICQAFHHLKQQL